MLYIMFRAGAIGAGAASRYGSGSTKMLRLGSGFGSGFGSGSAILVFCKKISKCLVYNLFSAEKQYQLLQDKFLRWMIDV
jgi:hypothetical protein